MSTWYKVYGPWVVRFSGRGMRLRVTVTGSDNADGVYDVPTAPFTRAITGAEWTVAGERLDLTTGQWRPHPVERTTSWDSGSGMRLRLDWTYHIFVDPEPGAVGISSTQRIVLDCTSSDPALGSTTTGVPPEFTIPGS